MLPNWKQIKQTSTRKTPNWLVLRILCLGFKNQFLSKIMRLGLRRHLWQDLEKESLECGSTNGHINRPSSFNWCCAHLLVGDIFWPLDGLWNNLHAPWLYKELSSEVEVSHREHSPLHRGSCSNKLLQELHRASWRSLTQRHTLKPNTLPPSSAKEVMLAAGPWTQS